MSIIDNGHYGGSTPGNQKKRFWSDEEKLQSARKEATPGVSVAQVAQRYSMNCNLIFKWLRDNRVVPEENAAQPEDGPMAFLPVEFGDPSFAELMQSSSGPSSPSGATVSARRVDITLSDGRRIRMKCPPEE